MNVVLNLNSYIDISILSTGVSHHFVEENFKKPISVEKAIEVLKTVKSDKNTAILTDYLKGKKVAVVYSNYFYDVLEKIRILTQEMGFTVLYCDSRGVKVPYENHSLNVIQSNIVDIFNYLNSKRELDNTLYISVNAVWRHIMPYLFRKAFSSLKIVSYMFDWLSFFCPSQHKKFLQNYLNLPIENIESEYFIYEKMLSGKIVDGILHKDGGENISTLKGYLLPKLYMPALLPENLQQPPCKNISNPRKFIFMGKLFSPSDNGPELFKDGYFFDIIKKLSEKNYSTDIYFVRTSPATQQYYKSYLKNCDNVRLIEGMPLDKLLPQIAGKYHWGYLINNYSGRNEDLIYGGQVEIGLPSRLLAYIALNIPVIISRQLTYAADFVSRNGLGVVITLDDLPEIDSILKNIDYEELQKNISKFRQKYSFNIYKKRFKKFINEVMQ